MPAGGDLHSPRSSAPVRVLLTIKGLGPGGAEGLLANLVGAGRTGGVDYEVACILASELALAPAIEASGTPVHLLGARSNLDPSWVPRFRRLLLDRPFDVVHFHLPYSAALGRPVVASVPRAKRPVTIYTEHSLWNKVSPVIKALNRATISRDRALICVSDAAFDALPAALQRRARVIVHGVDLSRSASVVERRDQLRTAVRAEVGVAPDELLAVTVAGLRSEKGYDVLLDAAGLVLARGLPLRFAAAGQGSLEAELAARHRALGLGDRFRFLGHRDDALELLAAADIVVLPSHQEGLPVVLMEATSVGAPIVATEVGGVPQIVRDGVDGLIVPPGSPESLADALERLVTDGELRDRLGKQAAADSSRFDITRAAREIEQLYREVLERP